MRYGLQIGLKFDQGGKPLYYPGNTVIADVEKDNPAYDVIHQVHVMLDCEKLAKFFIFLPEDSYHMTVIRGMNDKVREDGFWPPLLDRKDSMKLVDQYFEDRVKQVPVPEEIHMCFDHLSIDDHDVRVCLKPSDEKEDQKLRAYRDAVADALGFRLPGHEEYTYHITVAYMQYIPEQEEKKLVKEKVRLADQFLKEQPEFYLSAPKASFYNDMLNFYPHRIERKPEIKAILLDFDGTTLQKDQVFISMRNMYAIRKALDKGIQIIPSTGRSEDMQMKEFIIISHLLGQELWIITQERSYIRRSCHQKTERQCARYLKEKISTQRLRPMEKFTWKNPLMIIWSVIRFRLTMYGSLKKNGRLRWKNHPNISWNMELV